MPKELRKRGKKHKKSQQEGQPPANVPVNEYEKSSERPSWIISASKTEDVDPEAPFGYVDPDIKAYFRTVDDQIRAWQEEEHVPDEENVDLDPNEAKRLFFVAALSEMAGKERQLATDPDCSVVLERMLYSMDDFVRRVFIDSLCGSFESLIKHRFASHVCQTFFSVAAETVSREVRGIVSEVPESNDKGELRSLTQLMLDICGEIKHTFSSMIMDPFASHVLRSLLLLLFPLVLPGDSAPQKFMRSKKSMAWKAKQGAMESVFSKKGKDKETPGLSVPDQFRNAAVEFLHNLRENLNANEVRALAANKVASPVLQPLLEIEAEVGEGSTPDSLMDRLLVGMITTSQVDADAAMEPSDFLVTLLRDPTSSHLLETLVSRCPDWVFNQLWSTYFQGKLPRLALHPVANFVVSKAIERLDRNQMKETLEALDSSWSKAIRVSRTGVLRGLIERSRALGCHEMDVCQAIFTAFGLSSPETQTRLVPCVLILKTLKEYIALSTAEKVLQETIGVKKMRHKKVTPNSREPTMQGALILQSLLNLPEPHCMVVVDSVMSLSIEDLLALSYNATSSRVLDVVFESPTVPFKAKRRLVMSMIGHYHKLVDDRIGSRIGDRFWAFADPYLREKIARSIIPHEQALAASFYGKYFARNLHLHLLKRRPEEWKELQSSRKASAKGPESAQAPVPPPPPHQSTISSQGRSPEKRKRRAPEDEIDTLFSAALGNKTKTGAVDRPAVHEKASPTDREMQDVLHAIWAVPHEDSHSKKRRKK
ncbi:armadillo-type protein [Scleroderma yunnanense]